MRIFYFGNTGLDCMRTFFARNYGDRLGLDEAAIRYRIKKYQISQ